VNAEKTTYMFLSHGQNAGKNYNTKVGNKSFESEAKFKYLRASHTNQNCINKDRKTRLNSRNALHPSVHSLFPSCLLSQNMEIKIYRTIILSVFVDMKPGLSP
jgi:hypothetical protein